MKKLFTTMASIVVSLTTTAFAIPTPPCGTQVVTDATSGQAVTFADGTIIALQCLDTNGGLGYFFKGGTTKSNNFTTANLYQVVREVLEDGSKSNRFKLQNVANPDNYVGNNSGTVSNVVANNAEIFVASIDAATGWTTYPSTEIENGKNTFRFTASDGAFLNTQDKAGTPKYTTGKGGYSVWYVYSFTDADIEELSSQVDVTLNYTGINNEQLASYTLTATVGENVNNLSANNCPEFFTPTGVTETNTIINKTNTTFNVKGNWTYPFTLNKVFRADLRKSASNNCTKWAVANNNQISTRNNANAETLAPENLFYLKGHGYNSDNRLIVTLHTIGFNDLAGFSCAAGNNSVGNMESLTPTQWVVKRNTISTPADPGISLQHIESATTHMNDISGHLGVWAASASQNDGGSFIRFFDLTDSDFATTEYTYNGTSYTIDATAMATAQANPTSENVRALFPAEAIKQVRQVYVDMTYHGQSMLAGNFTGVVGKQYTFNAPPFFTDQVTVTIPATGDINFELQDPTLPFKHTATTDNMIWQAVHIHSSYADNQCYTWTYTEPNSKTMVEHKPANIGTEGYADNQLWAFVGNYLDGFKIYNKAAGTDKWLYGDDANVKVGTTEAKSIWKPYGNGVGLSHQAYCCLKADGTNYINLNVTAENGTTLTYWSGADQGSSCWFVAPAEPLLETAANFQFLGEGETYTGPRNAVGAILINGDLDLSYGPGVIAAAQANKYDLAAAEALRDLIAAYNSNVTVNQLEPNGFYRIQNILFAGQYLHTHETDGNIYSTAMSEADYRTNYHSIFKFEPVAGQTDRYYLLSQGHYVGHVYGTDANHVYGPTQTTDEAERGEFSLVKISHDDNPNIPTCAAFAIKDMTQSDYNFFHQGNNAGKGNYRISAWRQWAHGSHFYIVKADDIEIDLDQDFNDGYNNLHVGFGYFPFAVHATDNDTYFYTIHESYDKITGEPVITYSDIDGYVPAHTPFMVSHRNSSTAILAIGEPTASTRNNVRRRALSATDDNVFSDGTTETDNWTGTNLANNSWTPVGSTNAPAQVVAVAAAHPTEVNINNLRIMDRQVTITTPGVLTVDMVYTSGNDRLVIAGVALLSNDKIVYGDFHRGFSGGQKIDKVYTINVEKSGTYTLRYYSTNGDNALSTNGTITLTFTAQNNANLLDGGLRETGVEAGDYVLGQTSQGLGFVKIDNAASIKGNYVYLPASKLSEASLVAASELPLVNRAETTDIQELSVKPAAAANAIYDLQGRRLGAPVKGFNIVNGRKVYVK